MAVAAQIKASTDRLKPADKPVVWTVLALAAIGVVAVYSAIAFLAETRADGDAALFLMRHLVRTGIALTAVGIFSVIDYRRLARVSRLFLIGSIVLLVATLMSGVVWGGAQRWLEIGSFSFQPSDLAKIALVLHLAVLLARKQPYIDDFERGFLPILVWSVPVLLLIGIEDLSTAAVLAVAIGLMCFVARVRTLHLSGVMALLLVAAFVFLLASPGRAARVESWVGVKMFPHTEEAAVFSPQAEGYQARQSRIAFAMGGLTGVGPGKSIQRDFLPAPYNDFIFAIVGEEYGLVGAGLLLMAFVVLLFRGMLRIARQATDPLGLFLAVGLTATLVLYGFVNAGVASGLLPVTGLPMPFVSYGGTSMMATGVMVGILLNISRHTDPELR